MSYKKENKIVEEVKPKYEWITSHRCRRSFCTNEFLAGRVGYIEMYPLSFFEIPKSKSISVW